MTKKLFVLTTILLLSFNIFAQEINPQFQLELKNKIPVDRFVTVGKLTNGLTYYIHPNRNPGKFAELKLVVKAGSLQEDDDQQGVAHFLAHYALNGTRNFPEKRLNDFFRLIGLKPAPDTTVSASFEGTVFSLNIPTDSISILKKSLDLLKDWAANLSFEDALVNKTRNTVLDEWENGLNMNDRIFRKQVPLLFKNSHYANRITFGKKEVLKAVTAETLKRFYSDWYRPELMALIVVGDIDKNQVEDLIKTHFNELKNPSSPKSYQQYLIPGHKDTLVSIIADKNIPSATLLIHHEFNSTQDTTILDIRSRIPATLFSMMFNQRMAESKLKRYFPMTLASVSQGIFVANNSIFTLEGYGVKENKYLEAVDYLLTEFEKASRFGFKESELIRAKGSLLRGMQFESIERNQYKSPLLATKYLRNFTLNEQITGIDFDFEFYRKYLPAVTLEEVNKIIPSLLTNENLVVTLSMPAKNELKVPTEEEIVNVMRGIKAKEIFEYDESIANRPLIEKEPKPGTIKSEKEIKEIGVTEWTLSNGTKVIFKNTGFNIDEILMRAVSPGGSSLYQEKDIPALLLSPSIVEKCGLGDFDRIELKKYLLEKNITVTPFINELCEGINAQCWPFDFETMMKLVYLYFTSPRKDESAFQIFKSNFMNGRAQKNLPAANALQDSVNFLLYNKRNSILNSASVKDINLENVIKLYKERFANASDFTFFFVGNFTKQELKSLVEKYIASLPASGKKEHWKESKVNYSTGKEKKYFLGKDSRCTTQILYHCTLKYSFQNLLEFTALQNILNKKLLNVTPYNSDIISDLSVKISSEKFPQEKVLVRIEFKSNPENVDIVSKLINSNIENLKQEGFTKSEMESAITSVKKESESNLSTNSYWLQMISQAYINGFDVKLIGKTNSLINGISDQKLQKLAQDIFGKNNFIKATQYPISAK